MAYSVEASANSQDMAVVGEPASQPVIGEPQQDIVVGEPAVLLSNGLPQQQPEELAVPHAPPPAAFDANGSSESFSGIHEQPHDSQLTPLPLHETPAAAPALVEAEAPPSEAVEVSPYSNSTDNSQEDSPKDAAIETSAVADSSGSKSLPSSEETLPAVAVDGFPGTEVLVANESSAIENSSPVQEDSNTVSTREADDSSDPKTLAAREADGSSDAKTLAADDSSEAKTRVVSEANHSSDIKTPAASEAAIIDNSSDAKTAAGSDVSTVDDSSKTKDAEEASATVEDSGEPVIQPSDDDLQCKENTNDVHVSDEVPLGLSKDADTVAVDTLAAKSVSEEMKLTNNDREVELPSPPQESSLDENLTVEQNHVVSANGDADHQCVHQGACHETEREQELSNGTQEKKTYLQFMKVPLVVTGLAIAAAGVAFASISRPH